MASDQWKSAPPHISHMKQHSMAADFDVKNRHPDAQMMWEGRQINVNAFFPSVWKPRAERLLRRKVRNGDDSDRDEIKGCRDGRLSALCENAWRTSRGFLFFFLFSFFLVLEATTYLLVHTLKQSLAAETIRPSSQGGRERFQRSRLNTVSTQSVFPRFSLCRSLPATVILSMGDQRASAFSERGKGYRLKHLAGPSVSSSLL